MVIFGWWGYERSPRHYFPFYNLLIFLWNGKTKQNTVCLFLSYYAKKNLELVYTQRGHWLGQSSSALSVHQTQWGHVKTDSQPSVPKFWFSRSEVGPRNMDCDRSPGAADAMAQGPHSEPPLCVSVMWKLPSDSGCFSLSLAYSRCCQEPSPEEGSSRPGDWCCALDH